MRPTALGRQFLPLGVVISLTIDTTFVKEIRMSPLASPTPCAMIGCSALVFTRYCAAHSAGTDPARYRGSSASRGYDSDWLRVREQALKRDNYLCTHCLAAGFVTPAKDVDHRVPLNISPERRLDLDNLQSLCRPCHRVKTEKDKSLSRSGYMPDAGKHV